ncbi:two-component sensor histidine kinase [Paenibacillus sp. 598K]|uniref:sensor histidine kinase n=1 Tax=Paenibacillus sp. 598K TaxID=1117987 RepID=UPI000FF90324|nr:histidine kinase [Paenibacillus sp. 598K]GBF75366.1 two-component sensor histidine kinase [Paenibacillus sp. 598K]
MFARMSLFKKLILALLLMFLAIVVIFWWIYQLNVKDIQQELRNNKLGEVRFVTSQLNAQFEQILLNVQTLSEDQTVREYPYALVYGDDYSRYEAKLTLIDKLALNSASTAWNNRVVLYYPEYKQTVTLDNRLAAQPFELPPGKYNQWTILPDPDGVDDYVLLTSGRRSPLIIETRVSLDNLRKLLSQYTSGNPLLYNPRLDRVIRTDDKSQLAAADSRILPRLQDDSGYFHETIDGTHFLITYMRSEFSDLYFVDYHPVSSLTEPLRRNNMWFVAAIVALLAVSIAYSLTLRRQVERPVYKLRKAIDRFDRGDYTSRVEPIPSKEFQLLGSSFNRMAENTQVMIEQILLGELAVKEARLSQYQSQINPHFLYNCLNYIQSKASIADHQAVTAMTLHLAAYYRYIHKVEEADASLEEELSFVESYLSILHMRKKSITYDIEVPEQLRTRRMPRMILQPLVENCVQHGIEPALDPGRIEIRAGVGEGGWWITVADNGVGMEPERLALIARHMEEFTRTESRIGVGVRNVNQRLKLYGGSRSGLAIASERGVGTTYTITIEQQEEDNA